MKGRYQLVDHCSVMTNSAGGLKPNKEAIETVSNNKCDDVNDRSDNLDSLMPVES